MDFVNLLIMSLNFFPHSSLLFQQKEALFEGFQLMKMASYFCFFEYVSLQSSEHLPLEFPDTDISCKSVQIKIAQSFQMALLLIVKVL